MKVNRKQQWKDGEDEKVEQRKDEGGRGGRSQKESLGSEETDIAQSTS